MTQPRKPHAIHALRKRMNALSARCVTAGEQASEAARLVSTSIDFGCSFYHQKDAVEVLESVIAELKQIGVELAVVEKEPGHTRRTRAQAQTAPLLSEAA